MKKLIPAAASLAILIILSGSGMLTYAHDTDEPGRSIPIAKQDGLLEQGFRVIYIPVDILNGVLNAQGEFYAKGRAHQGQYARHGYYRTHARWYDPFLYHHED